MSKETLYKQLADGTFVPINDPYATDGLTQGCWLVRVEPGSTSIRHCIEPSHASVDFAFWMMADKISNIIAEASEARVKSKPLTKKEEKALKAFYAALGEEKLLYFEYPSIQDIAEKITNTVRNCNRA